MKNSFAPVILFVYKRLLHTQQTVDALKKNDLSSHSELFIYSDGPSNNADKKQVEEVRDYLKIINGFKSVKIIERQENLGLAANIIDGVTEVVNLYGRVIVMEDDLVTSPFFLRFMNDSLNIYNDDEKVGCIHGYIYPIKNIKSDFFIKGADCWGWATWASAWSIFEPDGEVLFERAETAGYMNDPFNIKCGYVQMLKDQISGKNNSWAVRWYFSSLLNNLYCLYPSTSYVVNIGLDDSGTHCVNTNIYDVQLQDQYSLKKIDVIESDENKRKFIDFHSKQSGLINRIIGKLKRVYR